MKRLMTLFFAGILTLHLMGQTDTTSVKVLKKNVVTVVDDVKGTQVKVGNTGGIEVVTDNWGDTTKIRIGHRTFRVIDDYNGTHINVERDTTWRRWNKHFNAHWAGIEWGINTLLNTDYSNYGDDNFMDLNYGKSITVNINFAEWAFRNRANNFAFVTGVGFSFMDFTFDKPLTIRKGYDQVYPVMLDPNGLKKSKLTVTYLTVPLMLELKTPLRLNQNRLYLGGGVIGGLNLGSHTKYKYRADKYKDRSNYYINQFTYDLTGRIGLGDFCLFADYSMIPLFEKNKGPEVYPFTVGISFPNL